MTSALEILSSKDLGVREGVTVDIEYRGLNYKVTSRNEEGVFYILRNLNGICRHGRLQAVMGPSGSGKTSLLDVLTGNIYGGRVEGQLLINGTPIRVKSMSKLSCYVMQHPVLLSSATVRESLMTSALLRLSMSVTRAQKEQLVQDIIEELGLVECANVLVGNEQEDIKGLSGGQIRRLAVGVELVTKPRLIVLDEPTSGLDSEIALTIMHTLKSLAQNNRTVMCSIHQPNSDMVDTFDDILLLSHGRTVYAGPWSNVLSFFDKAGFQCPTYKNPADYFMTVLKEKENGRLIADQYESDQQNTTMESTSTQPPSNLLEGMVLGCVKEGMYVGNGTDNSADVLSDVPWWFQTYVLWNRFAKTWMRNPILFWSEFVQYVFTGIFIGLMYYNVGDGLNFGTSDRYASHFFCLAAMMFVPSYSAVALWDNERKLLKVETNRKSYRLHSYYLAKTATTWPMEILLCLVLCLVVYWMIGYQKNADKFFIFFVVVVLFQLISESLGLLMAIITKKSQYALVLLSLVMLVIIAFTGFVVRDIPVYFQWIQDIAYVSFATAALLKSEFDGIYFEHPNGTLIEGSSLITDTPFNNDTLLEAKREDLAVLSNSLSVTENIAVLIAMLVFLRLINFVGLIIAVRYRLL